MISFSGTTELVTLSQANSQLHPGA